MRTGLSKRVSKRGSRISRRLLLQRGLCAALATSLREPLRAGTAAAVAITRVIGRTAERLPVIGLGTDRLSNTDYAELRAEIKRMVELGGTVIDTAAGYGDSEALIGRALEELGLRQKVFLATKLTGAGADAVTGKESFERSLARLRTTRIDLLQVHSLQGVDTLMPMLQQWKAAGKIRYLGVTTSNVEQHRETAEVMRKYPLDFVQFDYSIADRDAETQLLPLALERHIAVLANRPFGLATLIHQAEAHALPPWAAELGIASWPQFFLKYVVSHPAVTCAIPGSTKVAHLQDNQQAAFGRLPDAAQRKNMENFWRSIPI
jgi:aryl-alcohol dehydrogenase-like predicted oxidoreductase